MGGFVWDTATWTPGQREEGEGSVEEAMEGEVAVEEGDAKEVGIRRGRWQWRKGQSRRVRERQR